MKNYCVCVKNRCECIYDKGQYCFILFFTFGFCLFIYYVFLIKLINKNTDINPVF